VNSIQNVEGGAPMTGLVSDITSSLFENVAIPEVNIISASASTSGKVYELLQHI